MAPGLAALAQPDSPPASGDDTIAVTIDQDVNKSGIRISWQSGARRVVDRVGVGRGEYFFLGDDLCLHAVTEIHGRWRSEDRGDAGATRQTTVEATGGAAVVGGSLSFGLGTGCRSGRIRPGMAGSGIPVNSQITDGLGQQWVGQKRGGQQEQEMVSSLTDHRNRRVSGGKMSHQPCNPKSTPRRAQAKDMPPPGPDSLGGHGERPNRRHYG